MKLAVVLLSLAARTALAFHQSSGDRFSLSMSSKSTAVLEDRWAVVQERIRIADQGDTGAPPNLYWREIGQGQVVTPLRPVSSKPKHVSGSVDRWDMIQKHIFLADQGDCGPPSNLYWGTKGRTLDLKLAVDPRACSYVDRWEAVQYHIFLADEGDTGPLPNQYWGANAPRMSSTSQRLSSAPHTTSYDDRWVEVERRMFLADEGDCGVPPNLYWRQMKAAMSSSASLPPAQEPEAFAPSLPPAQELEEPALPIRTLTINQEEKVAA